MKQQKSYKQMSREERGKLILEGGKILKKDNYWIVGSQTSFRMYKVRLNKERPLCSCPDCELRHRKCKHIYAVEFCIKKQIDENGRIRTTKGVKEIKDKVRDYFEKKWIAIKDLNDLKEKFGNLTT